LPAQLHTSRLDNACVPPDLSSGRFGSSRIYRQTFAMARDSSQQF
jgi:hypothetical protein